MGKDKNLEETQELDVKTIRNASSKNVKSKKTASKSEHSKGGSVRKPSSASQKKKPLSPQNKKPSSSQKKKTASSQKNSVKTAYAPHKSTAGGDSNKVRRFPKEELQKQSSGKRSSAKRKKTIRKIKGIAVFALVCIIVAAFLGVFAVSQLFKIKTIKINYDLNKTSQSENVKRKYTDEQILGAADIEEGDNLLLVKYSKAGKISQSVSKQLPFLNVVSVESEGMSQLVLSVKQIRPAYAFIYGESYVLTDDSLNVIDRTQDKKQAEKYAIVRYANITSDETGSKLVFSDNNDENTAVEQTINAIKTAGLKKITYISLKNLNDLYMTYDNRILVHVGSRDNLVEKLKLAVKSLAEEDKNSAEQRGELNLTIDKKAYFTGE